MPVECFRGVGAPSSLDASLIAATREGSQIGDLHALFPASPFAPGLDCLIVERHQTCLQIPRLALHAYPSLLQYPASKPGMFTVPAGVRPA